MTNQERLENIHHRIIEQIATNMRLYGVPETVGRLMGAMYYHRKPMTLDDMSETVGMSKTRMSQAVRELMDHKLAEKVYEKGLRKDLYDVEQDYYQTFISLFSSNWHKGISMNRVFLQKVRKELKEIMDDAQSDEQTREKAKEYFDDSTHSLNFYNWLSRLVEYFESQEVFNHVPKTEDMEVVAVSANQRVEK
ncbi:GbsR/MarR family transcriptional regulator [Ammoniphilus resinae]|uniref:HTH-type transcriptional regulator n=1 Tax=Ammoniphilus resinae TaxID=861532 RepID=A0ABS4GL33_9BACL|nr:GbsR/MarR family transcriptional regulator [Ammoniphilus resinae]MBP1930980.1 DNA-binding transcriptional regulator GbsR (MarR family) [Ammoniphilus resinae]